jgi:site-specific recombinase XerD
MRHTVDDRHGSRTRAMIVVLWRAGLRVQEALALAEHDLDQRRGSILVRHGKSGRRREAGMDEWGWQQVQPWLDARTELPVGPLFCIIDGPTRRRPWSGAAVRTEFRRLAAQAGVRRRSRPTSCATHALELAREGVPLNIIQRQLGHANLGTTSIYLQGIDPEEIIMVVRTRRAPMMSASAGLRLGSTETVSKSGSAPGGSRSALPKRPPRRLSPRRSRLVQRRRTGVGSRGARSR